MTLARPLADDPILLGRQREVAALKVVGSGVDASQVGTGKTITSGRALAQRAATTPRLRALDRSPRAACSPSGARADRRRPGARPAAAGAEPRPSLTLDDRRPIAAQVRAFDRALGQRPGVLLARQRRARPPRRRARRDRLAPADRRRGAALRQPGHRRAPRARRSCAWAGVADCWLLTATPRGKSAEQLDVLVGLALGDEAMIRERLNTREAGDLLDELNAHRLRVNYGPHLVRVTRQDMAGLDARRAPRPAARARGRPRARGTAGGDPPRRPRRLPPPARRCSRELRALEPGSPLARAALAELARVQGVVLGNVGVYLDASVDPETLTPLQGRARPGARTAGPRRAEAMRGGGDGLPLLRGVTAQTIAGVAGEEQVLVFAERVRCLRQLAAHAARAPRHRRRRRRRLHRPGRASSSSSTRFPAGEFPRPVPRAASATRATTSRTPPRSCHLDLPWLPGGLEQRVGRAARPGAARGEVATYIPYIRGAGLEHVVSVLSPRGGEHHQLLDSFEGVPASESSVATQLGRHHRPGRRQQTRMPATPAPPPACASPPPSSAADRRRPRPLRYRRGRRPAVQEEHAMPDDPLLLAFAPLAASLTTVVAWTPPRTAAARRQRLRQDCSAPRIATLRA